MENAPGPGTIHQVRDRVIQQLTEAFTNDAISVDELEQRLDHMYRATTAAEVEAIVADIRPVAVVPGVPDDGRMAARGADDASPAGMAVATMPRERIRFVLSSSARRGMWSVAPRTDIVAFMADAYIDLSTAILPSEIVELHVRAYAANVKIIVPAGLRVVNRVGAFLANVETDTALDLAPMVPGSPVIRITGFAALANVEIVSAAAATGSSRS